MNKYRCENCAHFARIVGVTDANGKPQYKPLLTWGMCHATQQQKNVDKDFLCRLYKHTKKTKHDN